MQPIRVDIIEFRERLEALADVAHTSPVVVTVRGADELVVLSSKEWDRLRRRDRQVGLTTDLPDEWLDAVRCAEVPAELAYLDDE